MNLLGGGIIGGNNLPLMAGLPQGSNPVVARVWRSLDGQTFEMFEPAGLDKWTSFYQEGRTQSTTRIGNTAIFILRSSSGGVNTGVKTFRTNDFKSFNFNTASPANLNYDQDIVLWYDSIGGRLCMAGLNTAANNINIYTSTNYGASWTYQTAISTGTGTRFWGAAEGKEHIGISFDSSSQDYQVRFINKNTFANIQTSSSTHATSGSFTFLKGLGAGGASYGRFVSSETVGLAYWDESAGAVSTKTSVSYLGNTFIDVCFYDSKYYVLSKTTTGNDTLRIASTPSLTASPTWTTLYTKVGTTANALWEQNSNMVAHKNGITVYATESASGNYAKLLFSSDGVTFNEITNPTGLDKDNFMGYVP